MFFQKLQILIPLSALVAVGLSGSCARKLDEHSVSLSELDGNTLAGLSAQIRCADQNDCPSDVALLAMPEIESDKKGRKGSAAQCTGRMISENVLLTNGHCVPPESVPNGSCLGKMWAIFPSTPQQESLAVECAEILHASNDGGRESFTPKTAKKDYALIRLKTPPHRGFAEISFDGVKDNDELEYFRVNPVKGDDIITGELVRSTCKAQVADQVTAGIKTKSDAFELNDIETPVVDNCESMGGNSGTAILVNEKVVGVHFGGGEHSGRHHVFFTNFGAKTLKDELMELASKFHF